MSSIASTDDSSAVGDKRLRAVLATDADGSVTTFASCAQAAAHCKPDIKVTSAKTKIYEGLKNGKRTVYGYTWKYADTVEAPGTVWAPVPSDDVEGWMVSQDGRIKSPAGRIQSGCVHRNGHVSVEIAGKTRVQHVVVADAFLPPLENSVITHIDGDKTNNCVANLKRITRSELMLGKMADSTSTRATAVDQFTKDGEFIKTHNSMADANRSIGKKANSTGIKTCVAGKIAFSSGFIWRRHVVAEDADTP